MPKPSRRSTGSTRASPRRSRSRPRSGGASSTTTRAKAGSGRTSHGSARPGRSSTPLQRAQRQLREAQAQLRQARKELRQERALTRTQAKVIRTQQKVIRTQGKSLKTRRRPTTGLRAEHGTPTLPTPAQIPEREELYVIRLTVLPKDKDRHPTDYKGIVSIALKKPWGQMTEPERQAVLRRAGTLVRGKYGQDTWIDRVRYAGRLPDHERKELEDRHSSILVSWTG